MILFILRGTGVTKQVPATELSHTEKRTSPSDECRTWLRGQAINWHPEQARILRGNRRQKHGRRDDCTRSPGVSVSQQPAVLLHRRHARLLSGALRVGAAVHRTSNH